MNAESHHKISATHLARQAYLYVRQSTLRQVLENTESTKRQYALRERAVALGWQSEQVVVIDSDLGQSGADADRAGFQRLVAAVGMGEVGVVLGLEVSRLARSSSDWHRLLEICALADTLILDEDGLYDPSHFNDRLLLGMKGTMSEAELHVLRARLIGGQLAKARRGELETPLPVGLVYDATGKVVLDPDQSIQDALRQFFETFRRTGSATATVRSFRERESALSPSCAIGSPQRRGLLGRAAALSGPQRVEEPSLCRGLCLWPHRRPRRRFKAPNLATAFPGTSGTPSSSTLTPATSPGTNTRRTWPACSRTPPPMEPTGARAAAGGTGSAAGSGHVRTLRRAHDHPLLHPARSVSSRVLLPEPRASSGQSRPARGSWAPMSTGPSVSCWSSP